MALRKQCSHSFMYDSCISSISLPHSVQIFAGMFRKNSIGLLSMTTPPLFEVIYSVL